MKKLYLLLIIGITVPLSALGFSDDIKINSGVELMNVQGDCV